VNTMPIRLADNAIEELERSQEPQQADWWTWPKMYPSDTNGSGVSPGFEKELKDWIVQPGYENIYVISAEDIPLQITVEKSAEWATGAKPEQEKFITGYCAFTITQPSGAVPFGFGKQGAIIGNVPIGWQVPSLGVTPGGIFRLRGGLVPTWEQRLRHLSQLPEGWDSYGGRPVSPEVIEEAKSVLLEAIAPGGLGLPAPFIAPISNGGIGLEWKLESGKEFVLEIPPEGHMSYLLVVPKTEGEEEETEGIVRSPQELQRLLHTLE
jgi:hypothetical protein